MKVLKETSDFLFDEVTDDIDEKSTIEEYFRKLIKSEQDAIDQYETLLANYKLSAEDKEIIQNDVLSDEKDHVIIISRILEKLLQNKYPNNGEE